MHPQQEYDQFVITLFSSVPADATFRWNRQWWARSGQNMATNVHGHQERMDTVAWVAVRKSQMYKEGQ